VKELTKCQPRLWRELGIGTPSIVVIDTEDGNYYRASEADARIRHHQDEALCAEEAAMTHAQRIAELEPSAKWFGEVMAMLHGDGGHYLAKHGAEKAALDAVAKYHALVAEREAARADAERYRKDAERLDYIERTFSGMTNRERYLPVTMGWGKPCMGRTLREACDKYMKRDAARRTE
jgi:hypothetical protein